MSFVPVDDECSRLSLTWIDRELIGLSFNLRCTKPLVHWNLRNILQTLSDVFVTNRVVAQVTAEIALVGSHVNEAVTRKTE